MSYTNVYPSRINWENEPSIASPINATNLNKLDYAAYEFDQTFATWDITKANQSDLLLSVKSIDYDTETGVFVFTWQNGTTKTVDLNIEKIPVSFSMSPQGVITMTTDDGTTYTADVGSLIKTYTFSDSTEIDFTVTTDASGNKTVTAALKDGSIVGTKLEPNYLANCQSAANSASASKTAAEGSSEDSEAWAVGERGGVPVPSSDPAYNNNSKYWAQHTSASLAGLTDTDITSPTNGQVLTYDGTEWVNDDPSAGGGSKVVVSTAEASLIGTVCTLAQGGDSYSATFDSLGVAVFEGVTLTGTVTITATDGQSTATRTLEIPYFGNYTQTVSFFSATITATFPADKGATCTCDGVTASTSPYTFTVGAAGTYSVVCTLDGISESTSVTITTDGQTETHTFEYGTINLTFDNEFRGLTLTCTDSTYTITKTAPSTGNTMVFYPNETNTWTISGTYSGMTYTTTATVSSLSTPVSAILQTIPDGSTVTPTDVVQTWLKCAAINDKNYTTLAEVLNDTDTFTALLQDSNACDYMARSTTWAVATGLVPTMTSDTTPSGECVFNTEYSTEQAYKAFDGNDSTNYSASSDSTNEEYLGYKFTTATKVTYVKYRPTNLANCVNTWLVEYSDDNITWTSTSVTFKPTEVKDYFVSLGNQGSHLYWRIRATARDSSSYKSTTTLQFYADADITNNVDAMARIGKYDYCSYVLRNNNTWNTAITNSPYSSYIPASPTGQTNIIHSAASDTLYYIDGTSQTIGTTDTSGVGTVNWSNVPVGNLTIYSSVANDPDDLTSAYSKTVRITPHTTEVWLMPDDAVYWYGYESCEHTWNSQSVSVTLSFNTNNFSIYSVGTSYAGNITFDKTTDNNSLKMIYKMPTEYSTSDAQVLGIRNSYTADASSQLNSYERIILSSSTTSMTYDASSNQDKYVSIKIGRGTDFTCYALWLE